MCNEANIRVNEFTMTVTNHRRRCVSDRSLFDAVGEALIAKLNSIASSSTNCVLSSLFYLIKQRAS